MAKKLTGNRRASLLLLVLLSVAAVSCGSNPDGARPAAAAGRGGTLVATIRTEPRSFNRFMARDRTTHLLSLLMHGKLVQTNIATQTLEPALAEKWSTSPDGRTVTLHLRRDVKFSDGVPFTSADVVFSFQAAYDARTASPLGGSLMVGGKPLDVSAPDPATVVVRFPAPFGPGVRLVENLTILPQHKLAAALAQGTLRDAWGLTTPPVELVGVGPFVLTEYRPGERLTFARNKYYWRRDGDGKPLPRLDGLTLLVVPDQNAELLRLEAGEADLVSGEIRPEDLGAITRAVDGQRLRLFDVGVSLDADFLWFNLKAKALPAARAWVQRREIREAISLAIDRRAFADTVFLGAAVPIGGPVTPGNREWYDAALQPPAQDLARARQLLAAVGLTDKSGDGTLEAPDGSPARFALLTQKGHTLRERSASFIQQDLARIGLGVDVVTLEGPALIDRLTKGAYEAAFFGVIASDTDPASNLDYWLSTGAFHPWNPGQASPATPWEARIDALMQQQVATTDMAQRRRLFAEVQRIFSEHLPAIYFAAPKVAVATSARVTGARPGLLQPYVLWDPATLGVH
jgi:peptide/nickel transport system substrate-binding protein